MLLLSDPVNAASPVAVASVSAAAVLMLLLAGLLMPSQQCCYCFSSCCFYYYLLAAPTTTVPAAAETVPAAAALVPIFSDSASYPDTFSSAATAPVFNVPAATVSAVMVFASACKSIFWCFQLLLILHISFVPAAAYCFDRFCFLLVICYYIYYSFNRWCYSLKC